MDKVIQNKRGMELVTSNSSGYKFTKISLLVIYYQAKFNGIILSGSWVIQKITPANLCKPIHNIINYSISIRSSEPAKCVKEEEKLQKLEYLENEKSFLDQIKSVCWKNKNLIKNSRQSLMMQKNNFT